MYGCECAYLFYARDVLWLTGDIASYGPMKQRGTSFNHNLEDRLYTIKSIVYDLFVMLGRHLVGKGVR